MRTEPEDARPDLAAPERPAPMPHPPATLSEALLRTLWRLPLGVRVTGLLLAVICSALLLVWQALPEVTRAELLRPFVRTTPVPQTQASVQERNATSSQSNNESSLPQLMLPRVVLHIKYGHSPAFATLIKPILIDKGYHVPDIRFVEANRGPKYTQVRYFHIADKWAAQGLVDLLHESGARDARSDFIAVDRELPRGVFEIWFHQRR